MLSGLLNAFRGSDVVNTGKARRAWKKADLAAEERVRVDNFDSNIAKYIERIEIFCKDNGLLLRIEDKDTSHPYIIERNLIMSYARGDNSPVEMEISFMSVPRGDDYPQGLHVFNHVPDGSYNSFVPNQQEFAHGHTKLFYYTEDGPVNIEARDKYVMRWLDYFEWYAKTLSANPDNQESLNHADMVPT